MTVRKIIHIDMDCFYAAIEMRDFPELKGQPIAVGGKATERGVIATCNYEARAFGIRSAMSTATALRRCPDLILQPGRMACYREESARIRAIFSRYTVLIEPLSLDEAYLDVSECAQHKGSATLIAQAIRKAIYDETELTASAGIAPNKMLAKIASDWHKPNGQKVITPAEIEGFMENLSVRKLFGVGEKMEQKLHAYGLETCGHVQKLSQVKLADYFGRFGEKLYNYARGIDNRPVATDRQRKSISVEETYNEDLIELSHMLKHVPTLLIKLENRMASYDKPIKIHGLFVKLKFCDFIQTTVEQRADNLSESVFKQLLTEGYYRKNQPVRLLGLGIRLKTTAEAAFQQLELPGFE